LDAAQKSCEAVNLIARIAKRLIVQSWQFMAILAVFFSFWPLRGYSVTRGYPAGPAEAA
jgi:hypothetical protein